MRWWLPVGVIHYPCSPFHIRSTNCSRKLGSSPRPQPTHILVFFHTLLHQKQQNSEGDTVKDVTGVPASQYTILSSSLTKCCNYNGALICIIISCYKVQYIFLRTRHDFISKMQGHSPNSLPTSPGRAHCGCRELLPPYSNCVLKTVLCKISAG